jgi:apolipoprotein N-acyltransferase
MEGLGLIAASASLVALAFPPFGEQALAWIGLTPFFVAVRRGSTHVALMLSAVWLVLFAALVGLWFPQTISTYYAQPQAVGLLFFVGVTAIMGAPYYMMFTAAYRGCVRSRGTVSPLLVAAAWVTAELARGRLFTGTPVFIGNPWGLLGYSQVGIAPVVQIASVTGIYGVSFVVAAVNAALAECWLASRHPHTRYGGRAAIGMLPAVLALTYGFVALHGSERSDDGGPVTSVALVQGNVDVGATWRSELYGRNLDTYLQLTRAAFARARPRIIFWPEDVMTFFVEEEPVYRDAIARELGAGGAELVAGGPHATAGDAPRYFNSTFLVAPDGEIRARYDKQYLVPFAEYFPLRSFDLLRRTFERVRVFDPGGPAMLLPTVAGLAGVVTCNEAMLPEVVGARVAAGAAYLVNPSNDSWTSHPQYAAQQFDIVTVRAVEQRRYLVRASTNGPSAIIDPWGRIQVAAPALSQNVVVGTIRPRTERSVYGRLGDTFALACVACVVVALLRRRWR